MNREPAAHDRFGGPRALLPRGGGGKIAQPREALQIETEILGQAERGEIEPFDRHLGPAMAEGAGQQRLAGALVAQDRILGHRDQLQRHAAAKPQFVHRRPPGEAVEAVTQPLEQGEAAIVADPDQPLAGLDLACARLALHFLEEAHPLSPLIFSA